MTSQERWHRVKELFGRASELEPTARASFLRAECGDNEALYQEVQRLLESETGIDFLVPPHDPGSGVERIPDELGDFQLLERLREGGMGVVYRARQISLDREVAVKILPLSATLHPRRIERFRREAHAAAKLQHPGIVPVHYVGHDQGLHYFAMDFVRGHDLNDELEMQRGYEVDLPRQRRALPAFRSRDYVPAAVRVIAAVARALDYAHGNGVVHRDVKPRNVLLDEDGVPHIVDFGLARVEEMESLSDTGALAGTIPYMSPEQALAKRVRIDHRTDVFSLGVVLYELLTLERPFTGETQNDILYQIQFREPPRLRRVEPRIARDLETICLTALAKNPDKRYATAAAFADDLEHFLAHESILARPPSPWSRVASHVRRRRNWYAPAAAAVVIVAVLTAGLESMRERRKVQAALDSLRKLAALDERDLEELPVDELAEDLATARALLRDGVEVDRAEQAAERIELLALAWKHRGIERLRRGFAPPPGTPFESYRPPSMSEYVAGKDLVDRALRLLPEDNELERWADPGSFASYVTFVDEPDLAGARVYLQLVDVYSSQVGERVLLGELPSPSGFMVRPGLVRVTVVSEHPEGVRLAELTRDLHRPGQRVELRPRLRPTSDVARDMVAVPAGRYRVGCPKSDLLREYDERDAELPAFLVDSEEVTNGEYRAFLQATGRPEPEGWDVLRRARADWAELPVIVDFESARDYAEWAGKRLPTWLEWDAAARSDGRRFPWGDEPGPAMERAVLGRPELSNTWESYVNGVAPVGTHAEDVSPFGCLDVLGNVREWTESVVVTRGEGGAPHAEFGSRVIKGQDWDAFNPDQAGLFGVGNSETILPWGLRCVKSAWNE